MDTGYEMQKIPTYRMRHTKVHIIHRHYVSAIRNNWLFTYKAVSKLYETTFELTGSEWENEMSNCFISEDQWQTDHDKQDWVTHKSW